MPRCSSDSRPGPYSASTRHGGDLVLLDTSAATRIGRVAGCGHLLHADVHAVLDASLWFFLLPPSRATDVVGSATSPPPLPPNRMAIACPIPELPGDDGDFCLQTPWHASLVSRPLQSWGAVGRYSIGAVTFMRAPSRGERQHFKRGPVAGRDAAGSDLSPVRRRIREISSTWHPPQCTHRDNSRCGSEGIQAPRRRPGRGGRDRPQPAPGHAGTGGRAQCAGRSGRRGAEIYLRGGPDSYSLERGRGGDQRTGGAGLVEQRPDQQDP